MVCTHTKNSRKIAPGLHLRMPKRVLFYVTNRTWTFGHLGLSCTDFECFWNKSRESVSACVQWWKFLNFCTRDFTGPKTGKIGTSDGVFVIRLQLKWHNFWQWESFRGLVDIPRMCLVSFCGGIQFGHYKPTKTTNFGDQCTRTAKEHGSWCHLASDIKPWSIRFNVTHQVAACTTLCLSLYCSVSATHLV